ncbi:MAG: hypothetical protein IKK74_00805 [Clostridia bacterium]|nr:hypothetical protein [Clostridia bacterium]
MNAEIRFKDKRILEALEYIDEKYIDDVFDVLKEPDMTQSVQVKRSPFRHWKQYLALAACLILLAFATTIFGYVAEFIGSFAAGIGDHTSGITEDSDLGEVTLNDIENTENEQTTEEAIPNFQYSNVKIISDNNTSINPVSVFYGYSWYKDEKLAWTEETGWQYIINTKAYEYDNLPHLILDGDISSLAPENVSISSFEIYSTDWRKLEYYFGNLYELSLLAAGDYIIVGIEKERIPYEKPHYVVGEYDYKLRKSAAVFALSVTKQVESAKKLDYLKYIPELEEINDDTMLEVKSAWAEFKREDCYTSNHQNYLYRGYTENEAKALAEKDANQAAENAYPQLFNGSYFYYYGYLGTFEESVVIASYSFQQLKLIVGEVDFGFQTRIFVYTNEKIVSLQEAYDEKIITQDELIIISNRNEQYIESAYDYYIIDDEQALEQ